MFSKRLLVSLDSLPSDANVIFRESSFFSRHGSGTTLPTPNEVLAIGAEQDKDFHTCTDVFQPVLFTSLGLLVKIGAEPRVTIAEGQCLWAIRQFLPSIPVPEIYGWRKEAGLVFLYMEYVQGFTLEQRWELLSRADKVGISKQLKLMVDDLRLLRQDPKDQFLGESSRIVSAYSTNQTRPNKP
jgi:hypothetical protein